MDVIVSMPRVCRCGRDMEDLLFLAVSLLEARIARELRQGQAGQRRWGKAERGESETELAGEAKQKRGKPGFEEKKRHGDRTIAVCPTRLFAPRPDRLSGLWREG